MKTIKITVLKILVQKDFQSYCGVPIEKCPSFSDYEALQKLPFQLPDYFILWSMYYEAGSSFHNALLEATAWGL